MINKQPYESVSMKEVFSKGNLVIKLSFLIMGLANLLNRQIIKGLLFLVTEILFLISFFTQIIPALKKIITLGTKTQGVQTKVIDGIKMQVVVNGDNSMLILIFGLAAIIFCLLFVFIYWTSLKSTRKIYLLKKENQKNPKLQRRLYDFDT